MPILIGIMCKISAYVSASSFRRRPESSAFNELDTGLRRCDGLNQTFPSFNHKLAYSPANRESVSRCRTNHSITSKIVPRWCVTGSR